MEAQEAQKTKKEKQENGKTEDIAALVKAKEEVAKKLQAALEGAHDEVKQAAERIVALEERVKAVEAEAKQAVGDKLAAEQRAVVVVGELAAERRRIEELEKAHEQRKGKVEKIKEKKRELYEKNKELVKEAEALRKIDRKWNKLEADVADAVGRNEKLVESLDVLTNERNSVQFELKREQLKLKKAVEFLLEVIKTHPNMDEYVDRLKEVTGKEIERKEPEKNGEDSVKPETNA